MVSGPFRLTMIRHGEVHRRWRGVCYGASDVGLGPRGRAQHRRLAERTASWPIRRVIASDLRRTLDLATRIAASHGLVPELEPTLRERDFGSWERRDWQAIYDATGSAMDGMLDAPATWAPPGGETTFAVRDRVLSWFRGLASPDDGALDGVVVISHGGPIATLRGALLGLPVRDWPALIPAWGTVVRLDDALDRRELDR